MSFSRSRISRQFTDAESALDERISSHLTAPPLELRTGDSVSQSYKWLSEDLALRSTLSKQLAGEQQMAYAQSERHALADQALRQEEDDKEALGGITRARELLEKGEAKSAKDAIYKTVGENPRLGINPMAGKMFGDLERTFESPEQQELRQRKEDLDLAKLHNDKFVVDAQGMSQDAIGTVEAAKRNVERFQLEGITAANNALYEENRGIVVRETLRQTKEAQATFQAIGDPKNRTARIRAQGMLGRLGLSDVSDIDSLASLASQDELTLGALMDVTGRNEILDTPEKQQLYVEQWNALSSAEPGSPEYKKALSGIDAVTAEWDARNSRHLSQAKAVAVMSEVSKDFNTPWEKASKAIDSIYRDDKLKKGKPAAMLNEYSRFLSGATGQGQDELVAKYAVQVGEALKQVEDGESKITPEAINELISTSSLLFSQEFKSAKAQALLGKSAIKQAAKAADAAAPVTISTPEQHAALAPGTPYVFNGQPGVKR